MSRFFWSFVVWLTRRALALRYRIRVRGLSQVAQRGRSRIVFLANHPALIDPMILSALLYRPFRPRPLADRNQTERGVVGAVARHLRSLVIPDPAVEGASAVAAIEVAIDEAAAALAAGDNLLLYPAGHLQSSRMEDLRGNSAAHTVVSRVPDARVVLIRIRGLWGSRFSRAAGGPTPRIGHLVPGILRDLAFSGLLFLPRRPVEIEIWEPDTLPVAAGREPFNTFLEAAFNREPSPNTYVPRSLWEPGGARFLDDPVASGARTLDIEVPSATREQVLRELHRLSGTTSIRVQDHLARDLGLDSLARADLLAWLQSEFGEIQSDVDSLLTVADVLRVAVGETLSARQTVLEPIPARWFTGKERPAAPSMPAGESILAAFLERALAEPGTVILADQTSGVRSYRDLIIGLFVLRPHLAALPGKRVGIMLPASVGADVLFLAAHAAGKIPVMVNWTLGPRHVCHCLDTVGVEAVVTARALEERLVAQGVELTPFADRFVYLEEVRDRISLKDKLGAALRGWAFPRRLLPETMPSTAVVLFTSGSESRPKAVPLSHANLLSNLNDINALVPFEAGDRLLSMLPPFHSFGLTAGMLMPLLLGMPTVHYPNPRESAMLVRLVEAYGATLIGGTPTFLAGMMRVTHDNALSGLRLAVTGGEACPDRVYDLMESRCPEAQILEGYGVTECSPIVALNPPGRGKRGSIGCVLPSLEHRILDPDTREPTEVGERGLLLVRGPSVFSGYLDHGGAQPFVEYDGRQWYDTGDLVSRDDSGWLTFHGRLRRFVKVGGEMISLPAVEEALGEILSAAGNADDGPALAVTAVEGDHRPELILITTQSIDRATVNRHLRSVGLSPLHNIRRVERLESLPILGTGKTDYQQLQRWLQANGD